MLPLPNVVLVDWVCNHLLVSKDMSTNLILYPDFFVSAQTSPKPIIALYQILGCQYLLIPPKYKLPVKSNSPSSPSRRKILNTQPGLTPAGFMHWMMIQLLLEPQREFVRLNRLLRTQGVVIPRKSPELAPFPDTLPRGALPEGPDGELLKRFGGVFKAFTPQNPEIQTWIVTNMSEDECNDSGNSGGNGNGGNGNGGNGVEIPEMQDLRRELEDIRQQMWDKEQELKRMKVQFSQMQLQQQQQKEAAEADLRRRQSTSSVVSSVSSMSSHSGADYHQPHYAHTFPLPFPEPTIPESCPTPMPMPTPSPTPIQNHHQHPKPTHRHSMFYNSTTTRGSSTPPPQLPRHSSIGGGGAHTPAGYRSFQPSTNNSRVQTPIIGSNGPTFITGGSVNGGPQAQEKATARRRSSGSASTQGLPTSLCISPVAEGVSPKGDGFKRDDEFARIMGF